MKFQEAMAMARTRARDHGGKRKDHDETDLVPLVWEFVAEDPVTGDDIGAVADVALVLKDASASGGVMVSVRLDLHEVHVPTTGRMAVFDAFSRALILTDALEGLFHSGLEWNKEEIDAWIRARTRGRTYSGDGLDPDPDTDPRGD
jgi:hypothetical protein